MLQWKSFLTICSSANWPYSINWAPCVEWPFNPVLQLKFAYLGIRVSIFWLFSASLLASSVKLSVKGEITSIGWYPDIRTKSTIGKPRKVVPITWSLGCLKLNYPVLNERICISKLSEAKFQAPTTICWANTRISTATRRTLGVTDYDMDAPLSAIRRLMLESNGLLTIAFRRTFVERGIQQHGTDIEGLQENAVKGQWLTTPWAHIEPAMAFSTRSSDPHYSRRRCPCGWYAWTRSSRSLYAWVQPWQTSWWVFQLGGMERSHTEMGRLCEVCIGEEGPASATILTRIERQPNSSLS